MRGKAETHYFRATGFSPYYFAHVIYNVVRQPSAYLRSLDAILGDLRAEGLCRPFARYSNLHCFIEDILEDLFFEEPEDSANYLIYDFLVHNALDALVSDKTDLDELSELTTNPQYDASLHALVDEVFHVLFLNLAFLRSFNLLTAGFICNFGEDIGERSAIFTSRGRLKRVAIPQFAQDAIYYREQGECRSCKKAIDRMLAPSARERYDHIVSLAQGGANDISNLQLLCDDCNSKKSDLDLEVSNLYGRAYPA